MLEVIRNLDSIYIFMLGVIIGLLVAYLLVKFSPKDGVLMIDTTNPEFDKYLLHINDLDEIANMKQVILKVDINADLSRK